jgi:hypothetical protein
MVSVPVVMHAVVLSLVDWGVASAFASAFLLGASVMAAACAVTVFVQKTRPSPCDWSRRCPGADPLPSCLGISAICEFGQSNPELSMISETANRTLLSALERRISEAKLEGVRWTPTVRQPEPLFKV